MAALLATVLFPQGGCLLVERFLVAAGSALRVLLWLELLVAIAHGRTTFVVGYLAYTLFVLAIPVSRLTSIAFNRMDAAAVARLTSPEVIVLAAVVVLFAIASVFMLANTLAARREVERAVAADLAREERGLGGVFGGTETDGAGIDGTAVRSGRGSTGNRAGGDRELRWDCRQEDGAGSVSSDGSRQPGDLDAARQAFAHDHALSARETDVLELIVRGYSAKRAGEKLCISESTVVSHTTHIYRKVGVSSKQELIALVEAYVPQR